MRTDVVIIGGGVIGSAIAYYLTKRGKKVILLEKKYLVNGSSGACDQGILLQSKAPNEHLVLGIYSLEMFKKLEQELGRKLEFVQKGYLVLIESEPELKVMQEIVQKQNELGLPSKIITKEEALAMQPGLNPDAFVAAACCDWDGEVNPYMLTMAFADKAEELGAVIKTGCPVTGLVMEDGAVKGVETQEGTIYADTVVNAAGVWAPEIGAMAGIHWQLAFESLYARAVPSITGTAAAERVTGRAARNHALIEFVFIIILLLLNYKERGFGGTSLLVVIH